MNKLILLVAICYSNFLLAQVNQTSFKQLALVNEQWYKQTGVKDVLYTEAAKPRAEKQLIQYHLQQVELLLRNKDVSKLSVSQKMQRLKNLDVLHGYMEQGIFPVNDKFEKRIPFFIDKYNTYCAVGYLMKTSGADEMAKQIHATQNNSYLLDIQHESLKDWVAKSGLTVDELALIQPGYILDKPAFLLEIHYNNIGADVNEYIEFMQGNGVDNNVDKILFFNESNVLYKTLLVSQMQAVTLPTIIYGTGVSYFYTPKFYYYTFSSSESFADAGKIEFRGTNEFGNVDILRNEITYNASAVITKDFWNDNNIGGLHEVTKSFSAVENETTSIGTSLTFSGNYVPTLIPPAYSTYNLNNWNAYLLPATPGTLNILSVLPVSLSNFNCSIKNNNVLLNWETLNEINASYFNIEKSTDGIIFETIGKVNSAGNSTTNMQYSFVDEKPFYINHYRLKQVDDNGRIGYSKIVSIKAPPLNPITIFENPVKNNLQIKLNIDQLKNANIIIMDFTGRKLLTQKAISGFQKIDITKLNSGQYVIQLVVEDGNLYNKIFVKGY